MILDTLTVTAAGKSLIAAAVAQGGRVVFTRCAVGNGVGNSDMESMTAITDEVGEYTIEAVRATDVAAIVVVKEAAIGTAYYLREIGLFAKLGEGSEILFASARESENPEYIQPIGSTSRDVSYTMQFTMVNAADAVVQMASAQYIKEMQKGKPNGVASLDESGKVPKDQLPDSDPVTLESLGAAPKAHTHAATDIGAAPKEHTHAASTISAGTFASTEVCAKSGTEYWTSRVRNIVLLDGMLADESVVTMYCGNGDIALIYE